MSQSHIPQPNSQSAAPAEVFDSTANAPHSPSVSSIGTGDPSPTEAGLHAGQFNSIDKIIKSQFFPIDTWNWTTSQVRGTLLWYSPVHPSRCNSVVNHLSQIYNTWAGGLQYNFKIAGTGFHAGALAFVRIPPNRHPSEFKTPSDWGAFEYEVIDPKTLEVVTAEFMDQRRFHYHYMQLDEKNPDTFGGYVACYVLIPLNTSSTGTLQISVQAFCRPGAKFSLDQLIVPASGDDPTPNVIKPEFLSSLEPRYNTLFISAVPTISMKTNDKATQVQPQYLRVGMRARFVLDTEAYQKFWEDGLDIFSSPPIVDRAISYSANYATLTVVDVIGRDVYLRSDQPGYRLGVPDEAKATLSFWGESSALDVYQVEVLSTYAFIHSGVIKYGATVKLPATVEAPKKGTLAIYSSTGGAWRDDIFEDQAKREVFTIPAKSEVFLSYTTTAAGRIALSQTCATVKHLLLNDYSTVVPRGSALLLAMVDRDTSVPLGHVKYYREGFMTMNASMEATLFKNPVFSYVGIIPETAPITFSPEHKMNALTLHLASSLAKN